MKQNLVVCPSRERPRLFEQFLKSFFATSKISDLIVFVVQSDPCLEEYLKLACADRYTAVINNIHLTTTALFNWGFLMRQDYAFYTLTNDDFVYQTPGWDEMLCQAGKISYGNDLAAGFDMPTMPVIDGDFVRALGWLQLPELQFMYGDNVWKMIGHKLDCLRYCKDVIIEHCHWQNGKRPADVTTMRVNSTRVFMHDEMIYRNWLHNEMLVDINKIKTYKEAKQCHQKSA